MVRLGFVSLVLLAVIAFMVMGPGAGNIFAGGEEETIEPVEEELVIRTEKPVTRVVWFVMGFLAAVFLMAL